MIMEIETEIETAHYLNDLWTFYFHDPSKNDWKLDSYMRLIDINSIEQFWIINNNFFVICLIFG